MEDVDLPPSLDPLGLMDAMGAHFTLSSIIASLLFGVIGLYLFRRGRALQHRTWIFIGLALMIYPMFTSKPWQDWGIGAWLCAWAYYKKDPDQ